MSLLDSVMLNGFRLALRMHGRSVIVRGPETREAFDTAQGNRPEETIDFSVSALRGQDGADVMLSAAADVSPRVYTVAKEDFLDGAKLYTPCEGWTVIDGDEELPVKSVDSGMNGLVWRITTLKR